jgi:hypothetical protein
MFFCKQIVGTTSTSFSVADIVNLGIPFFYHITQWFTPAIGGIAFDAMCIFWIVIGVIGFITKKSRTVF